MEFPLEFDPALKGEGELARLDLADETDGGANLEDEDEAEGGFNPDRGAGIPPPPNGREIAVLEVEGDCGGVKSE